MQQACIGSKNFYLKTLKELDECGYIRYEPSYDTSQGSRVYIHVFDTVSDTDDDTGSDTGRQTIHKHNTNSINRLNGINAYGTSNEN
jgi:hypothetical protein